MSHDPSEIILIYWFAAQETFIIINVENSCEGKHFFEIEIFSKTVNVFTVTFDQLNPSLLDKSFYFLVNYLRQYLCVLCC